MLEILKKTHILTPSDVDCHGLIRLSALLVYMQDLATEHSALMKLGRDKMEREYQAVWMMARLHLTLDRPIVFPSALTIHTYHRGVTKSASVYRDFDLFIGDERAGEATISWVVVDIQSRRIRKPGSIQSLRESPRPAAVKERIPEKIKMPQGMTAAMVRTVHYSDTDLNGHMNNTKYADIACDAIRYDLRKGQFLSEVKINYLQECFPGEDILVQLGEAEGAHYVRGADAEGRARFEVRMRLEAG
jgi:acyl-ACP thioesterase